MLDSRNSYDNSYSQFLQHSASLCKITKFELQSVGVSAGCVISYNLVG